MSNDNQPHITSYFTLGAVLVSLLILTAITVVIAEFHFGKLAVVIALLVACIKASIVLTYFMHLKFESRFMRGMVIGLFSLYALVMIITFFDYGFR